MVPSPFSGDVSHQLVDGERVDSGASKRNAGSGAAEISGRHSAIASGNAGSRFNRSETSASIASETRANEDTFGRLNQLDIRAHDAGSPLAAISNKKKRKGSHNVGADKTGRGLRQFSMKVCNKVESKGRTTYNEVADELVAEFSDPNINRESADQEQYDGKNIRRRVYDALNVLMAMDIISKDKKEIQWKGLPQICRNNIDELKKERLALKERIDKKTSYLQEMEEQYVGLRNLIHRNERLYGSGNTPTGGISLPYIIVQTRPNATVEVEISEDMQLVHFDFNSTPFELHDDSFVLKAMRLCERFHQTNSQVGNEPVSNEWESPIITVGAAMDQLNMARPPSQPENTATDVLVAASLSPKPGILKGAARREA